MLGSHSLEISSTFDQNGIEYFKAPHHSVVHIENQSPLQFYHPPFVSHDIIAQSLEESYVASEVTKRKFSSFFMFSRFQSSKGFACMSSGRNVYTHHHAPIECFTFMFITFFSTCSFKLRMFWFALSYLFCLLLCLYIFLDMHSHTFIDHPMCQ